MALRGNTPWRVTEHERTYRGCVIHVADCGLGPKRWGWWFDREYGYEATLKAAKLAAERAVITYLAEPSPPASVKKK